MLDRWVINIKKKRINKGIKKAKELIKKERIFAAEKLYGNLLKDYKAFCKKATYIEKLGVYHNLLYIYNELKKRNVKEEKPGGVKKEASKKKKWLGKPEKKRIKKKEVKKKAVAIKKSAEEKEEGKEEEKKEEKTEEKIKEIKAVAVKGQLKTVLDDLYSYVQEKGNITIMQAASKFKVTRDKIEEWAKILEDHGLLKIYYPAFTGPQLRSLGWIQKQEEKKERQKKKKK